MIAITQRETAFACCTPSSVKAQTINTDCASLETTGACRNIISEFVKI